MNDEDKLHKIRMSIDIHSLRNNNFQGNIYVKYNEVPFLGSFPSKRNYKIQNSIYGAVI